MTGCDRACGRPLEEFHRCRWPRVDLDHFDAAACIDDQIDADETDWLKPLRQNAAEAFELVNQSIINRWLTVGGVQSHGAAPGKRACMAPRLPDQLPAHAQQPRESLCETEGRRQGGAGHEALPDVLLVECVGSIGGVVCRNGSSPPPDAAAAGAGQRLDEPRAVEWDAVGRGHRLGKRQPRRAGGGCKVHRVAESPDHVARITGEWTHAGDGIDEIGMVFDRAGVAPGSGRRKALCRREEAPGISLGSFSRAVCHGHGRRGDRLQVEITEEIRSVHGPAVADRRFRQRPDGCSQNDELPVESVADRFNSGIRATHDDPMAGLAEPVF